MCALALALAPASGAATPADAQAGEDRAAAAWHPFRSVAGRFQVLAPSAPERIVHSRWTVAGRIDEIAYHFEWRGERYGVTYHDLPRIARMIFSDDGLLDRIVDELLGVMNGSLLREDEISLRGNPGRVVSYRVRDRPGLVEEVRILLVERRLYLVEVGRNDLGGAALSNGSARRFFDSFELIEP
jgi:hypothetical protein